MSALSYRTETVIRRPPQDVFDYCSDLRSELQWNPKVKYVEKLTDGPVRVGTCYRARWANSGPTAVEVVQFDRPRHWETKTTARGMSIRFQGTVTDAAPGAHYTAQLELRPRRLARLVAPLALLAMRRQDQQNMRRIREALESSTVTRSA
jgi:Polyketide cyclase / dehydrase and lipid transport